MVVHCRTPHFQIGIENVLGVLTCPDDVAGCIPGTQARGSPMRARNLLLAAAMLTVTVVIADDQSDESKAIAKIELLGGKVTRDDGLPDHPVLGIYVFKGERFSDQYMHL